MHRAFPLLATDPTTWEARVDDKDTRVRLRGPGYLLGVVNPFKISR
jgi:hypothetical protein